jgi:RyR domain
VPLTPHQLARLCHEADRVLCCMQGDARVSPWETLDEEIQDEVVAAVREVLEHPELTDEARHARWLRQRRDAGWSYGPVRSIPSKTDPALLEYDALPSERRLRRTLFGAIVRILRMPTAAEASRRPTPGPS